MAYGLQINKANTDNIYDSNVVAWLQVGQFEFPAMDADTRFVDGQTYQVGDFVRTGTGFNEGSSFGDRWERVNTAGATTGQTIEEENAARESVNLPVNWVRAEIVIPWDTPFPSNYTSTNLTTTTQTIDVPPDDQEGYLPHIDVNINRLRVSPFFGYSSVRIIVIVLVQAIPGT